LQYYETKFENKSISTVVIDEDGRELLRLEPGWRKMVESQSPLTSYAAWSKIVYEKDGTVKLTENPDWKWPGPPDQLMLTIINRDGAGSEMFHVSGGEPVICYKGIPRMVAIPYWDAAWRYVEKLEIKNVDSIEHSGDFIVKKKTLQYIKTMRSKKEIAAIDKHLIDDAIAQAKMKAASEWRIRSAGLP